jgi:hypothetical protein
MKKNSQPCLFIIIIVFASLSLFYSPDTLSAQSFKFYDSKSNMAVTSGFTLLKNSAGRISYPQSYQGRLWFAETHSLEKPAYVQYSFLSDNFSIDYSKTPAGSVKILKGEAAANSSTLYAVYLTAKSGGDSYQNSSQPPAAKYSFGYNPYASSGGSSGVQTQSRTQVQPQPQTQTQIQNRTISYSGNSFGSGGGYQSALTTKPSPSTTPATTKPQPTTTPATPKPSLTTTPVKSIPATNTTTTTSSNTRQTITPSTSVTRPTTNTTQSTVTPAQTSGNTRGGVSGYISGGSTPFGGGSVIVSVTNSNNQIMGSQIVNTDPGTNTVYPYTISGIPKILPGSNDYYRISVTSNNGFQTTQYSQPIFKIYSNSQTVYTQPVVMQANRGKLNITLYHKTPGIGETEAELSLLARNAVINISGSSSSARFTGESPARFYRYTIDDAPAGQRTLAIMFPGHGTGGGGLTVTIPSNATATVMYNLSEGQ